MCDPIYQLRFSPFTTYTFFNPSPRAVFQPIHEVIHRASTPSSVLPEGDPRDEATIKVYLRVRPLSALEEKKSIAGIQGGQHSSTNDASDFNKSQRITIACTDSSTIVIKDPREAGDVGHSFKFDHVFTTADQQEQVP
jgi:hypothetical protein